MHKILPELQKLNTIIQPAKVRNLNLFEVKKFTDEFHQILINIKHYDPIALVSHDNTDLDGAASVLGMYLLIRAFSGSSSNIDVILSHTNQFVKRTLQNQNIPNEVILTDTDLRDSYNTLILLDTPYVPPYFKKKFEKIILIDHHLESTEKEELNNLGEDATSESSRTSSIQKVLLKLIESTASSCSELIAQTWKFLEEKTDRIFSLGDKEEVTIAQLLLMGILMDSAGLRYSQNSVVPVLDYLIQKGADIPTVRKLSVRDYPMDVKLARIKGAIRTETPILLEDWIILITHVNSHESAVCTALLGLGADLAFCISRRKKQTFRVIARASERFQQSSDFHLAKFMEILAEKYIGNSGGHKGAAGMNGQNYHSSMKEEIITELKKELNTSLLYENDPE